MAIIHLDRELARLQADLGLSHKELAAVLDVSALTLKRWHGGQFPQAEARVRLERLGRLRDELHETFQTREAAIRWVHEPSRYLGGFTPAEVLRLGYVDRVEGALGALGQGLFV